MVETAPAGRAWSVSALLLAMGDALAARFSAVTVQGELSGFSRAASGHCYFTLKDADGAAAALRCAMFRRTATLLDFAPRDGAQVELRGRVALYEARGELQLVVESMRPLGAGLLYEQFLRTKAKLEAEGLFDAGRKRSLPPYPRTLGVVTSIAGAALHDILSTLARRAPHVAVVVYPSSVQGEQAPAALAAALGRAALRREVDLLIVARGGGSLEDLWAFNDERVVRAIAALPMPCISGVGHETDVTLADFAADRRAPTPTAAAEFAAPARDDMLAMLAALAGRARSAFARRLDSHAQRLDRLALQVARPAQRLARERQRLQALAFRHAQATTRRLDAPRAALPRVYERLHFALHRALHASQLRLAGLGARLDALDPTRVLARGYAAVFDTDGRPVPSARRVAAGQTLDVHWHDGRVAVVATPQRKNG